MGYPLGVGLRIGSRAAVSQAILERLGATPEQLDRERARVHNELLSPDA